MSFKQCLKPNLRSKAAEFRLLNRIYVMQLDSSAKTESTSTACWHPSSVQKCEHKM